MQSSKHLIILFTLTLLLSTASDAQAAKSDSKSSKILQEAQSMLDSNQVDDAEKLLRKTVKDNPEDKAAALMLGIALYRQNRFHAARQVLEKLTAEDNNSSDAWLYLARTYQKGKRLDKAIPAYETFLEKVPPKFAEADKYRTLVTNLKQQWEKEKEQAKKEEKAGDYIGDVTESGIFRWSSKAMPIKVFIKNGDGVPGYRYQFDESIRDAFDQWELRTNGLIKFDLVDDPSKAIMTVTWTNDLHSAPLKAEMGHAKLRAGGDGIERADIELLTVNRFEEGPIGARLMRNVCLHEVGHALGLQGHSPYKDDIMYPQLNIQDGISGRDLNTLKALYSKDAQDRILNAKPTIRQNSKSRQQAILSNLGSQQAVAGKFEEAYETLSKAIKFDRSQKIVRQNLAAVTNNMAIKQDDPDKAVKLLHESLYWEDKDNTRQNLAIYLNRIDVDPKRFEDRVKLSEQLLEKKDFYGAVVEIREALKLKEDATLAKKLQDLEATLDESKN